MLQRALDDKTLRTRHPQFLHSGCCSSVLSVFLFRQDCGAGKWDVDVASCDTWLIYSFVFGFLTITSTTRIHTSIPSSLV